MVDKSSQEKEHEQLQATPGEVAQAFQKLTAGEGRQHGVSAHAKTHVAHKHPWLQKLIPGIEKFENSLHIGNYVAITRGPDPEKQFESMPVYARLGMHLLFYGRAQTHLLRMHQVEDLFKAQSVRQGQLFDSTEGALEHIQQFVEEYDLAGSLEQLVKPNLEDYKTFNEFFYRELKPEARPVDSIDDPAVVVSAADCRLTVFQTVEESKEFWIKDHSFSIRTLLEDEALVAKIGEDPSIAIFRLAPGDYHRWHSPVDATLQSVKHLPGQYYTVNPMAVNEDFAVFTANRRDIAVLDWPHPSNPEGGCPIVTVAIGALLVGAITWLQSEGEQFEKGKPQGYFAYGGSTIVVLFPGGVVKFDDDLVANSKASLETKVAVGNRIGARL